MRPEDDARAPLDGPAVVQAVVRPGGLWHEISISERTGSTNADLLERAAVGGAPEGLVLATEEQTAGRGRLGRTWVSPPRSAVMFSVLLRPGAPVPPARLGWLPLLAGVAAASAVGDVTGLDIQLKWPNDLLAGAAKLGGILAEAAAGAVVIGIGLNVSTEPGELPPPGPEPGGALAATSLRVLGSATLDRAGLLAAILTGLEQRYRAWREAGGDAVRSGLHEEYTRRCTTIGRDVRVDLPGGQVLSGPAVGIDPDGRLLVRSSAGAEVPVAAGDVVHVR